MTPHVAGQVAALCSESQPAKAITNELALKHWETCQVKYHAPVVAIGNMERSMSDGPRSRMQRYRTTEAGLAVATGHAFGRLPAESREGGQDRRMKGKGR